jgi:hypothetical protein
VCCRRSSNIARIDKSAAERVYEFRTNEFLLINHRKTVDPSPKSLGGSTLSRFNAEQQSILFRFTVPQKDGKIAAGKGKVQIGAGRYNCDGTYSYYSETAAKGGGDAARWYVPPIEADVNPDETNQNLVKPTFKNALPIRNRVSYLPYLNASDWTLEWEGASQGFDIIEMPTDEANTDCVGSYSSNSSGNPWRAAGKTISYGRLDVNNTSKKIQQLGINFCQLLAFGPTPATAEKQPDCQKEARCTPGEGDCMWQRLPDSLCPEKEDAGWGCHLGTDKNADNDAVKLNCTDEAPKESSETPTSDGQCCDPLGKSSSIPACNAWLQINEFVAGAVEITDKPADDIQQKCD